MVRAGSKLKQVTYPDGSIDQVVGSVLCLDSRPVHRVLLLFTVCVFRAV